MCIRDRDCTKVAIASTVRILGWRYAWPILFQINMRTERSNSECWTLPQQDNGSFCDVNGMLWIGKTSGRDSNSARESINLLNEKFRAHLTALSGADTRTGHQRFAIWHHGSSSFGSVWNFVLTSKNHKQLKVIRRVIGKVEPQLCGSQLSRIYLYYCSARVMWTCFFRKIYVET